MLVQLTNNIRPGATTSMSGRRADARFARRPGGFSLLELVIVLAVVSALAAIGSLRYARATARYRVQAACARVVSDLRMAQTLARITSSSRTVLLDAAKGEYRVLTAGQLAANADGTRVSLAADPYRASMRVDGLPGNALRFDGRGGGNAGAIVSLRNADVEAAVIIEPNTGRAYVAGADR